MPPRKRSTTFIAADPKPISSRSSKRASTETSKEDHELVNLLKTSYAVHFQRTKAVVHIAKRLEAACVDMDIKYVPEVLSPATKDVTSDLLTFEEFKKCVIRLIRFETTRKVLEQCFDLMSGEGKGFIDRQEQQERRLNNQQKDKDLPEALVNTIDLDTLVMTKESLYRGVQRLNQHHRIGRNAREWMLQVCSDTEGNRLGLDESPVRINWSQFKRMLFVMGHFD